MVTGATALRLIGTAVVAEHLDQLVMHDLDDLLAGRHRAGDFGADGALAHLFDKGADHFERYVGFDQRAADFAQRGIDIGCVERAAATKSIKDFAKPIAKAVKHVWSFSLRRAEEIWVHQAKRKTHPWAQRAGGWWPPGSEIASSRSAGQEQGLMNGLRVRGKRAGS